MNDRGLSTNVFGGLHSTSNRRVLHGEECLDILNSIDVSINMSPSLFIFPRVDLCRKEFSSS